VVQLKGLTMSLRHLAPILLLLLPTLSLGQPPGAIVLGGPKPTVEAIQQAKSVLAAAEEKEVIWNVGEFDVLVRGATAKGEVRFDSTDESVLMLDEIPAGVVLWLNDIRAGQKDRLLHKFDKQTETYWIARAAKEGRTTIKVWANGENGKPPVIVARLDVRVGKPKPPPPPPPDPDNPPDNPDADATLVKEFRDLLAKDKAVNNGPWDKAKAWAKSYVDTADMLGIADPAFPQPKTLEQLYEGHKAIWLSAQVPTLPFLQNTRGRISEMMTTAFGKVESSPVDREKAAKHYRRIGLALLEALK
jgi:hypothetical protein